MTKISEADKAQLKAKGISEETLLAQLERFRTGFPYLKIDSPATMGAGITAMDDELRQACVDRWNRFLADGGDVVKFVPASGAASRMFKKLFEFVNSADAVPETGSDVDRLLASIDRAAFAADLDAALMRLHGADAKALIAQGRQKDVVAAIINPEGLNYGNLPKALLKFHRYGELPARTALEEQLSEAAEMAEGTKGAVRVHFTVSANHENLFQDKLAEVLPDMEQRLGVKFDVTMSQQKPSTDTLAATADNEPFRNDDGSLVFRPGGHGALIENLNDIDSTVVFVKNIDNIAKESQRADSVPFKHILGGMLLLVRDNATKLAEALSTALAKGDREDIKKAADNAADFVAHILTTRSLDLEDAGDDHSARARILLALLDRPFRVCGMVRNEGEPGGGPYNAFSSNGRVVAPQILESSQIDLSNDANKQMMANAAYFNPVDLACCIKRNDGSRYNLPDYVDHNTGFISSKSLNGRELRALELPGLWNGAMSDWNTVFIEVPALTFTPAKTVNDLLRPAHQA